MRASPFAFATLTALVLAGCDGGPAALAPAEEETLAAAFAADAAATFDADEVSLERLFRRLVRAVRERGEETAQAMLDEAHTLRAEARAAREAGDLERARLLAREAYQLVLEAIVRTFPNAPTRVGAAVDRVVDRMEQRLGDRAAPRIHRVLARVGELRTAADRLFAEGDAVRALALNLRAARMLVRLVHHLRHGMGEGDPALDALDLSLGP